ncbi:MAG: hypothetical protein PWQ97_436 [Tepidanaerobacteraceae bacterium]|nr:hypothetical protein [Tepidanaerobacteraceae bacterium]
MDKDTFIQKIKEMIGYKDFETLVNSSIQNMIDNGSKITNFNIGGVTRDILEAANKGISDLHNLLLEVIPMGYAAYAEGEWLDAKCLDVKLFRNTASKTEGKVKFYRELPGETIVIKAGSILKSKPINGKEYNYLVKNDVTMNADATYVYADIIAESAGACYNIGPGLITVMVTYIDSYIEVTNEEGWITKEGTDTEDDESLRQRYFLKWSELAQGATDESYISWAKSVSGVQDVTVDSNFPRGQGTVDVIITGPTGAPSQELINEVQNVINKKKPNIANVLVKGPDMVSTEISVEAFIPSLYMNENEIKNEIKTRLNAIFGLATYNGVSKLGIGQSLYISALIATCMMVNGVYKVNVISPQTDIVISKNQIIVPSAINVLVMRI